MRPVHASLWLVTLLATIAVSGLALGGCTTIPDDLTEQAVKQYGDRCTSHFWGNSGFGATLGFDVSCKPPAPVPEASIDVSALKPLIEQAVRDSVAEALE